MPQGVPYTRNTQLILEGLASLNPATVATMHGSSFTGDCRKEWLGLGEAMREVLDKPAYQFWSLRTDQSAEGSLLCVVIESPSALLPQPAGVYHFDQQRAGAIFGIA